jgi:hypothetical protein
MIQIAGIRFGLGLQPELLLFNYLSKISFRYFVLENIVLTLDLS